MAYSTLDKLTIGINELGEAVRIHVPGDGGRHLLVGGATNAGKSELLNVVVARLARRPNLAITGHDPKRVELGPWRRRMTTVAIGTEAVDEFLDLHLEEMERRYEHMAAAGLKKLPASADWPHIVAVFDELAAVARAIPRRYVDDKGVEKLETKAMASARVTVRHAKLAAFLERCRAAGMGVVLCTQRPSEKVVPLDIRDNCRVRIAFGTESWEGSKMILGDTPDHVKPHNISESNPGEGWLKADRTCTRFKGFRIHDELIERIAEDTATLRMSLAGWPRTLEG